MSPLRLACTHTLFSNFLFVAFSFLIIFYGVFQGYILIYREYGSLKFNNLFQLSAGVKDEDIGNFGGRPFGEEEGSRVLCDFGGKWTHFGEIRADFGPGGF